LTPWPHRIHPPIMMRQYIPARLSKTVLNQSS